TVGNRVFTITQFGLCSYSISPTSVALGETAGSGSVSVTSGAGCTWAASSTVPWITITAGSSGSGGGTVTYSVTANSTAAPRSGTLNIAGEAFTVVQTSCGYTVSPLSVTAGAGGATSYALLQTGASCPWTASSASSWITFPAATSGSGSSWVTFRIGANGGSPRSGSVTIAGRTISVAQDGICTYTVTPLTHTVGSSGGPRTVTLTTGGGCGWITSPTVNWITINQGSTSGAGSATIGFTVAPYTGATSRTGTIRIGGITVTITQSRTTSGPTTPQGLRVIG
ncbi:MAG: BACON domain-containing protein, partial [Vicinamibacterales bacterium]